MAKKQAKVDYLSEHYVLGFKDGAFGLGIAMDLNKKKAYIDGYKEGLKALKNAEKQAQKNNV